MDRRLLARLIAAGRVLFGASMLIAPKQVFGAETRGAPGPLVWMLRCFGIRDVVLGVGALLSLGDPDPDPSWVRLGAVADTCDTVAALVWREELGPKMTAVTLGLAVPAAVGGWVATTDLREGA